MKRRLLFATLALIMLTPLFSACGNTDETSEDSSCESGKTDESHKSETVSEISKPNFSEPPESVNLLFIGNSFAADTAEHTVDILQALGVKSIRVAYLYQGGCSINKHYSQLVNDIAGYEYYANTGKGWSLVNRQKISTVVSKYSWDYIVIQHGTLDGSKYADVKSYENLEKLIAGVRELAKDSPKIAFNMTWVGEANSNAEMTAYGNDALKYFNDICKVTRETVSATNGLDLISPAGTAVQNARTATDKLLTRDGYHLSYGLGRYIAGLTLVKALTNVDISNIGWAPEGVSEADKQLAVSAANAAYENPFEVTDLTE